VVLITIQIIFFRETSMVYYRYFSTRRRHAEPLRSFRLRIPMILAGLTLCVLLASIAAGAPSKLAPGDIRVDIPRSLLSGSLPTNRGLSLAVQVHDQAAEPGEQLVAIFESPAFVQQISPLLPDPDRRVLSTTVALGPISASLGNPPKAAPVHIAIARQRGLHLEERARRTFFVTVAVPGYADHGSRPSQVDLAGMAFEPAEAASVHGETLYGPLLEGKTEETDLLGNAQQHRTQGYWRMLNGMLHRQIDLDRVAWRPIPAGRMPVVHFRLYTNGEAQLIEIERSSGDANVDQAAILAVVNAHPFPPIPTESRESHVDVHANMPISSR
jgi:TonB family protein